MKLIEKSFASRGKFAKKRWLNVSLIEQLRKNVAVFIRQHEAPNAVYTAILT